MTLTIQLTSEQEARLRERAAKQGQDPAEYAGSLVNKGLAVPALEEIIHPIREEFAASGMTEVELDNLIEAARDAVYTEKHSARAS